MYRKGIGEGKGGKGESKQMKKEKKKKTEQGKKRKMVVGYFSSGRGGLVVVCAVVVVVVRARGAGICPKISRPIRSVHNYHTRKR